jgi:hypothetical protein
LGPPLSAAVVLPNHCQRGRAALAIELHLPAGFCGVARGVAGKLGPPVQKLFWCRNPEFGGDVVNAAPGLELATPRPRAGRSTPQ